MVECCGFQASATPSGGGGRGWEKREKKQTTPDKSETDRRTERGGFTFKRASTVTVRGRITWFGVAFALLFFFLSFFLSFTRNFDLPFYFNHLYFNRLTEACLNEP